MIRSKSQLLEVLASESHIYGYRTTPLVKIKNYLFNGKYSIGRYMRLLRYTEYYHNNSFHKTRKIQNLKNDLYYIWYHRKLTTLGSILGLEIGLNSCKEGLTIYHQNCIINYEARIGKNAKFHGLNCVGNTEEGVPTIGDNVEFGVGASVIGNVSIADNVKIGAGAVVTKSVLEVGAVIAGIPAKKIK